MQKSIFLSYIKYWLINYLYNKEIENRTYDSELIYYEEYYPLKYKNMVDEIDIIFVEHYNFIDEEFNFIINYDIKYRMWSELGGKE